MAKRKRKRRSGVKTVAATCKQGKGGRLYDCKAWKSGGKKRAASGGRRGKRFHPRVTMYDPKSGGAVNLPYGGERGRGRDDLVTYYRRRGMEPGAAAYGARFAGGLGAYPQGRGRPRPTSPRSIVRRFHPDRFYSDGTRIPSHGPRRPLRRVLGVRLPRRTR